MCLRRLTLCLSVWLGATVGPARAAQSVVGVPPAPLDAASQAAAPTSPNDSSAGLAEVTSSHAAAALPRAAERQDLRPAGHAAKVCGDRGTAVSREFSRHPHTLSKKQIRRAAVALCHEAERTHLDPLLLLAVIGVESSFNPHAISPVGAEGLMQLMPVTGQFVAARVNLAWSQRVAFDPAINIRIGTRYLATLRDAFHGRMDWALTAYNRGPTATHHLLREHRGLPRHIRALYASRVLRSYERLKRSYASAL